MKYTILSVKGRVHGRVTENFLVFIFLKYQKFTLLKQSLN